MSLRHLSYIAAVVCLVFPALSRAQGALPDVRQLMKEVQDHQRQLDKVKESFMYTSLRTIQDLDGSGKVTKTETEENDNFYVNGHLIERTVKKNGRLLSDRDDKKETERVTKLIEKAQKLPPGQALEGQSITVGRILDLVDVSAPRRETFRGRPTIVFDFVGRKNAKTHGFMEDASKKLRGTMWVDEGDRQVVHLDVAFFDNVKMAGGLVANLQKGSNFRFDQAQMEGGLWLPAGGEASIAARVLLLKAVRQHVTERMYDYKKYKVDAQQLKDAKPVER